MKGLFTITPWRNLHKPKKIQVITPEGVIKCSVDAYGSGDSLTVDDVKNADIEPGDEIRYQLPNEKDDVYEVVDPKFFNTRSGFPPHYQIKMKRKGSFPHGKEGYYNIKVEGHAARVNIHSQDYSKNVIGKGSKFEEISNAIFESDTEERTKANLIAALKDLEKAQNQEDRSNHFQKFIALASSTMPIVTPFLPYLAEIVSKID